MASWSTTRTTHKRTGTLCHGAAFLVLVLVLVPLTAVPPISGQSFKVNSFVFDGALVGVLHILPSSRLSYGATSRCDP